MKIGVLDTFPSTGGKSNVYSLNKISTSHFPVTSHPTRKYTKTVKMKEKVNGLRNRMYLDF